MTEKLTMQNSRKNANIIKFIIHDNPNIINYLSKFS